jgi:hypothetical protein
VIHTLWRRLFPPGGEVAVAKEPLDNTRVVRWIRANDCSVSFRQGPICLKDAKPEAADLDRYGRCWWWDADELMPDDQRQSSWVLGWPIDHPGLQGLWMPYRALCDPREP